MNKGNYHVSLLRNYSDYRNFFFESPMLNIVTQSAVFLMPNFLCILRCAITKHGFDIILQMRNHQAVLSLQMKPFVVLLHETLDQLIKKDTHGFFAEPVPLDEVLHFPGEQLIFLAFNSVNHLPSYRNQSSYCIRRQWFALEYFL